MRSMVRARLATDEQGLTFIELLVVVFPIAILTTVGMISFLGFRDRGNTTSAAAGVRAIVPSIESYFADKGTYSGLTVAAPQTGYDRAIHPLRYVSNGVSQTSYCVQATAGDKSYTKARPAARVVAGVC